MSAARGLDAWAMYASRVACKPHTATYRPMIMVPVRCIAPGGVPFPFPGLPSCRAFVMCLWLHVAFAREPYGRRSTPPAVTCSTCCSSWAAA